MKRRYYIQKHTKNPFTRITGVEVIELLGGQGCWITKKLTHNKVPMQQYAYYIHNDMFGIDYNPKIHITSICGINNCIKKDHLQATYHPYKADQQYIADNIKTSGLSHMAHMMKITPQLLQQYLTAQ